MMCDVMDNNKGKGKRKKKKDPVLEEEIQRMFQHDSLLSALTLSEAVDYESLTEEIASVFGHKSPVSSLIEFGQYMHSSVNIVDVGQPEGSAHSPIFTMNAVVGGIPYKRVRGRNKKECRNGAAYLAWKDVLQQHQNMFREMLQSPERNFKDKIAAISHLEYLNLVERSPGAFCGKKVLAAFLVCSRQKKTKKDVLRVVSLGMGNRCIMSQYLVTDGTAVNDSHAEILARRALVKYLLKELELYYSSHSDTIFEKSRTGKAKLKASVTLHLYISTAPCGDCALFSRTETNLLQGDGPIFTNDTQGLLRSKIEAGEGCLPTKQSRHQNQSLVSLKFKQQLRTMCCSDKVCKWNVLGVQGALLSHFTDPLYINSITIGKNYMYGHMVRAVGQRFGKDQENYTPSIALNPPYKCHIPELGNSDVEQVVYETEHSLPTSVTWNCVTNVADVFDGVVGRATEGLEANRTPSVAKKVLFEDVKRLCSKFQKRGVLGKTYLDSKEKAVDYQRAKQAMYRRLEELGYGNWLSKPLELEMFE